MSSSDPIVLQCSNVEFARAKTRWAINDLVLKAGDKVFVQGPSGSGKTTLLNLVSGLLKPDTGTIRLLETDITTLSQAKCDRLRGDHLGFIFQQFNLVPYLSVLDNVLLPVKFSKRRKHLAVQEHGSELKAADDLLSRLGLSAHTTSKVSELSVGQQQRVAAARAFMGAPDLVLADEPTSALDRANQQAFIDLLFDLAQLRKTALLFVSHDDTLPSRFDRVLDVTQWVRV